MGKHIYIFVSIVQAITGTLLRVPLCTLFPISPRDIKVSRQNSSHVRVRLLSTDLPNFKFFWKSILVIYSIDQKQKMYDFSSAFHFFPFKPFHYDDVKCAIWYIIISWWFLRYFSCKGIYSYRFHSRYFPLYLPVKLLSCHQSWHKYRSNSCPAYCKVSSYFVNAIVKKWPKTKIKKSPYFPHFLFPNHHIWPDEFFDVITPWPKNLTPKTTRKLISKKC